MKSRIVSSYVYVWQRSVTIRMLISSPAMTSIIVFSV